MISPETIIEDNLEAADDNLIVADGKGHDLGLEVVTEFLYKWF